MLQCTLKEKKDTAWKDKRDSDVTKILEFADWKYKTTTTNMLRALMEKAGIRNYKWVL